MDNLRVDVADAGESYCRTRQSRWAAWAMAMIGCCAVAMAGCGHAATPAQNSTSPTASVNAGDVKVRGIAEVLQAVGVYPSNDVERAAFDRLAPDLTACAGLHAKHYDFAVNQPDTSTVVLNFNGPSPWKMAYRVKSSVLINVAVLGLPQSGQTAQAVLATIADRIK